MCARHGNSQRDFIAHAQKTAMVIFICLAVWALTGFPGLWPAWVALFLGLRLGNHARRVYGRPAESVEDPAEEDAFV